MVYPDQKQAWFHFLMNKLVSPPKSVRFMFILFIFITMASIVLLVYFSGGIQYVYSHTMYIPIVLSGLLFGWKGGLLGGIAGGILLGPFMPVDVENAIMQEPMNWIYRTLFFSLIGVGVGIFKSKIMQYHKERLHLFTHHPGTDIPGISRLIDDLSTLPNAPVLKNCQFIQIRFENYIDLSDFLSNELYSTLLMQARDRIQNNSPEIFGVYAKDEHSLMLVTRNNAHDQDIYSLKPLFYEPFDIEDIPVYLDVSIGISSYRKSIYESIYRATLAARYAGNNGYGTMVYDDKLFKTNRDIRIMGSVKKSLEDGDFSIVFQPQFDHNHNTFTNAEVLLRWEHPEFGTISPGNFIPLIEKTSLINIVSDWVIEKSLKALNTLYKNGYFVSISINISTMSLFYAPFYNHVKSLLKKYEIPSDSLIFEITESALMHDPSRAKTALEALNDLKIKIAIDDFGTGYSSLSYMHQFPVHQLKIDKSFIDDLDSKDSNSIIVRTAINLARDFNITSIAEGVETSAQYERLCALKCDMMQGFYHARPMPFDKYKAFLKSHS